MQNYNEKKIHTELQTKWNMRNLCEKKLLFNGDFNSVFFHDVPFNGQTGTAICTQWNQTEIRHFHVIHAKKRMEDFAWRTTPTEMGSNSCEKRKHSKLFINWAFVCESEWWNFGCEQICLSPGIRWMLSTRVGFLFLSCHPTNDTRWTTNKSQFI